MAIVALHVRRLRQISTFQLECVQARVEACKLRRPRRLIASFAIDLRGRLNLLGLSA